MKIHRMLVILMLVLVIFGGCNNKELSSEEKQIWEQVETLQPGEFIRTEHGLFVVLENRSHRGMIRLAPNLRQVYWGETFLGQYSIKRSVQEGFVKSIVRLNDPNIDEVRAQWMKYALDY